jgi:thiol-disulfide isomerase/thioredoxin
MRQFTQANYKDVLSSEQTAMVFFTSSGCHLCLKLKPILKKLEKQYAGSINFYLCDIDKEKKLSNHILKDEGVPTGFIMKDSLIFKIKDPESPDNDSWYSEEYLQKLIKVLQ